MFYKIINKKMKWISSRKVSLNYNESYKTTKNKKGKVISHTDEDIYTITFSDKSTITLHDLNPESLAKARVKFTEKMDELAVTNSNVSKI